MQLLLKRRADPRATNRKGEAPLAMAQDDAIREAVSAALAAPPPSAAAKQVGAPAGQASRHSRLSAVPRVDHHNLLNQLHVCSCPRDLQPVQLYTDEGQTAR